MHYTGGRFILGDDTDSVNITAWMPLPEPYRKGEPPKQTNADRIRSMTDEVVEQLNDKFRVVRTDEDLEWNRAMDEAITIVKGGGVDGN